MACEQNTLKFKIWRLNLHKKYKIKNNQYFSLKVPFMAQSQ